MWRSTASSSPDSPRRWLHLSEEPCWWALWRPPRPFWTAWTHRRPDPFLSGPISWEDIWSDQMSKMISQEFYYLKLMAHILSCWASCPCYLSAAKSTLPNFSLSLPIHPQVWFTLGPADTSCIISQYLPRSTEQFLKYWLKCSHAGEDLQVYMLHKLEDLQCTAVYCKYN